MITPLHNHSTYSALDGLSTPKEIAARCVELEAEYCGLTDHGVVAGHLEFEKELSAVNVKPIYGCEVYHGVAFGKVKGAQRDQAHFITLAMTDEGLKNLWRLLDATAQDERFHHVGRITWDDAERFSKGIVATSACVQGLVPQGLLHDDYEPLNRYLNIYKDNFYIELHTYNPDHSLGDEGWTDHRELNLALVDVAQERGIPVVYADDAHFDRPERWKLHDIYVAMSVGDSMYTPRKQRKMWHPSDSLYIKDEQEVRKALDYLPESVVDEAIKNATLIGERANAHLPEVRRHLPTFIPSESPWLDTKEDSSTVFVDLVEEGIINRYGEDASEEVWDRAIMEMEVFLNAGLEHYFLLAWEVSQYADENGIERGPGRGSSAGCIVAYALGITDVDPIHYGLVFERFYNAGREKGLPDIDTDFAKSQRNQISEFLSKRWGHDRVRTIGNIGRLKPKATIDRLSKGMGLSYKEADELKKILDGVPDLEILGPDQIGWTRELDPGKVIYVDESVGDKIDKWINKQPEEKRDKLQFFIDMCEIVCNRVEGYGVHASGVVISDVDLPGELPCRWSRDQKVPVTQFNMDDIDLRQFMKYDRLGLRTLDTLADWKAQMAEKDIEIDWSGLDKEEHPDEMWDLLGNGFAAGIFQVEANFPKRLCEEFKPRSVSDLAIIVALNRPGPIRSGAPDSFIKRRNGEEEITYDDPFLEDILNTTYGWFLYQEQVIAYFNKLGYTLSESDTVRKILGKKQPERWDALYYGKKEWKGRAYTDLSQKVMSTEASEVIWQRITDFAKYSFNLSHAIAYGIIGFRTTFAKYYGPSEFYMACIRNVSKEKKAIRVPAYVNEARRMDIEVLPPDIKHSRASIAVVDGDILYGLGDVKNVGISGKYLTKLRDEWGIPMDDPDTLTHELEELTDIFNEDKAAAKKKGKPFSKTKKSPKQQLQANKIEALWEAGAWDNYVEHDRSLRERQEAEKELLSVILTDNTAEAFAEHEEEVTECDSYAEAQEEWDGEDTLYWIPGIISNLKETKTRAEGKKMGIVSIEYEGEELEFIVFPSQWRAYKFLFKERTPVIIKLKRTARGINFEEGYVLND